MGKERCRHSMRKKRDRNARGFTLVETVIALALMSAVMVLVITVVALVSDHASREAECSRLLEELTRTRERICAFLNGCDDNGSCWELAPGLRRLQADGTEAWLFPDRLLLELGAEGYGLSLFPLPAAGALCCTVERDGEMLLCAALNGEAAAAEGVDAGAYALYCRVREWLPGDPGQDVLLSVSDCVLRISHRSGEERVLALLQEGDSGSYSARTGKIRWQSRGDTGSGEQTVLSATGMDDLPLTCIRGWEAAQSDSGELWRFRLHHRRNKGEGWFRFSLRRRSAAAKEA